MIDVNGACRLESTETDVRNELGICDPNQFLSRLECRKRQVDEGVCTAKDQRRAHSKTGEGDRGHNSAISKLKTTCDLCERGKTDRCEMITVVDGK